jgi:hypothetical protein
VFRIFIFSQFASPVQYKSEIDPTSDRQLPRGVTVAARYSDMSKRVPDQTQGLRERWLSDPHMQAGAYQTRGKSLLPTLIPLSGVGACFHFVVIKIRQLYDSLKLEWMLTTANAAGTNGLTCLRSTEELQIINFGYPLTDH